ncbi:tyrosine-type recombinase/integrase [Bacteroides thetaiotaomicron]|uniref:site-specific integrase n=1 Tax=Bacteroides thetaiotaomicron TaxID=818 RepID=UPI001C024D4A|nr:site-specific integrase [Bacteroides thetaiotaomicron]MBT9898398.1 tyrosine-type recombinase/integrase [Bacteroides thetaiotaomicron]
MARKSFSVLFFIKKGKLLKNGEAPVCMRITVNGCMVDISIKRSCPVNLWNQAKENSKGKDRMSVELNHYIEITRSRIHQIYRELETSGKAITVDLVRKLYYGVDEESKTLLQVFREHNEQSRKLIGKDFVSKTVQRYETTTRYLTEFIKKEYQLSDIPLNDLEPGFISKFDAFLKIEKGCAHNSSITRLKNLKKIIRIALQNEWIKKDPFAYYRFKIEDTEPEFLTMDEIKIILDKEFTIKRIEQVRDIFIFCTFTGLAFSDVKELSPEHLIRDNKGELWIRKSRQKTNVMCNIPVLPVAASLLNKYKDVAECTGKLLPVLSNQRMNSYLKEIADICGIHKNLTTHCARHSYATSVCLANGVSMENVAKMLGHTDTSTTKHYARVLDQNIFKDMQKVNNSLSELAI